MRSGRPFAKVYDGQPALLLEQGAEARARHHSHDLRRADHNIILLGVQRMVGRPFARQQEGRR